MKDWERLSKLISPNKRKIGFTVLLFILGSGISLFYHSGLRVGFPFVFFELIQNTGICPPNQAPCNFGNETNLKFFGLIGSIISAYLLSIPVEKITKGEIKWKK